MEGSSAGGGRRGCCEDACPWEREEAASLAWDRRLRELSQSDVVRLIGASVERGDMPPIAAELLECDTCRIPWADPARWGRLVGVIRDYLVTETGLVVVDSPEELAKAEVLLFSDRDVEARRRLARGLVGQVWRRQPPTRAPWHSRLMQLVRDIDVCCFMLRLLLSRCTITMEPLVTPYCDVDAVADAFRQSDSAGAFPFAPAKYAQTRPPGRPTSRAA
ncbi:Leu/Phe-tRNA protein transferase, putative [Babesia caballi]|uniref:Leu/Phe-tRNA protein transferase, putative n=1 Tax=Babesia caballi TaxID=5871 RepID=A0AAV4LVQ2_BABCB|nr:Leu/Phe-tRNA protein transferase, putative [Babesia caballi]